MPDATGAVSLSDWVANNAQTESAEAWQLESERMLEINLNNERVFHKVGAMKAYYGQITFERASSGGLGKMMKSMMTAESSKATIASGTGRLYLGDEAKEISILRLANETLYVNSSDLLAYTDGLDWDIVVTKGAGMVAGGLFSFKITGSGLAAISTHGQPLVLGVTEQWPLCTDPDATVAWSEGLQVGVKTDVSIKTFTGRASGESYQMTFAGRGFVVVQPYEELAASVNAG